MRMMPNIIGIVLPRHRTLRAIVIMQAKVVQQIERIHGGDERIGALADGWRTAYTAIESSLSG